MELEEFFRQKFIFSETFAQNIQQNCNKIEFSLTKGEWGKLYRVQRVRDAVCTLWL